MEIKELHWLMNMITHIDVGLVVIDRKGKVHVWNQFMENHSGISSTDIKGHDSIYELFPSLAEEWLQKKLDAVMLLDNEVFITWEQHPHLLDFLAYRPVTGGASKMYQNVTLSALREVSGETSLLSMMIYDVTDIAVSKLALEKANAELAMLSRTDRLTGLFNRGYWQEQLILAMQLYKRYKSPCSLIMFDIDHFKKVNDTYGHQAGDQVIQLVASMAAENARQTDVVGRYGGEEFGIILPETNAEGARVFAERLREQIAAASIPWENLNLGCTVSLGVAEINETMTSEQVWLEASDQALYASKRNGRNCTSIAGE